MTEINQNSLASHRTVDEASGHPDSRKKGRSPDGQILDDNNHDSTLGSVNISFNAHLRLRAYEDQKNQLVADSEWLPMNRVPVLDSSHPETIAGQHPDVIDISSDELPSSLQSARVANFSGFNFSEQMNSILSEVENNIVQTSEPGYQYLVNMLNNYKTGVEDPQQLQEIMRREEFYLSRRKPFMESADFHSYSQVLSQFSNIIERHQYSS